MELIEKLNWRYATKAMNGEKVPQEKVDKYWRQPDWPLLPVVFSLLKFW